MTHFNLKKLEKTFVIAEIGSNHGGRINVAIKMIEAASRAGANAVKVQSVFADSIMMSYADGYDSFKKEELSWEHYPALINASSMNDILFFSTPFDLGAVHKLEQYDVPLYKISSGDITNQPLLEAVAHTNKPVIISTGGANSSEIVYLKKVFQNWSGIALLHCTLAYPAPYGEMNLRRINELKAYADIVGLSDHSLGVECAIAAVAMGAKIIEKHFTIDKSLPYGDNEMSMTESEFKSFINSIRAVEDALGSSNFILTKSEKRMIKLARRSIVAARDLSRGSIISLNDISMKRPGNGIAPCEYVRLVGKVIKSDIKRNHMYKWSDFEEE